MCQSNLLGSVRFTQEDLNIIPYKGSEQLVYIASSGNQIIFNGANRISHYGAEGYQYVEFPKSDDYCPGNYYYTETNAMDFHGTTSGSWLNFDMAMTNPFIGPIQKHLGISLTVRDSVNWVFSDIYRFDSLQLFTYDPPYGTIPVNDSVLIGSKIFYKVYVLQSGKKKDSSVGYLQTVYYSLTEGVLGFRNEPGETWCLQ